MTTQRKELSKSEFNFTPTTFEEAFKYATMFANSGLCPETYKGRPNDILIIWETGRELGLGKMASLRTFGCIKGTPFTYGSGKLALIKRHPEFEDMREWFEGKMVDESLTAFCMMKRKNQQPITRTFSIEDAKRAGLWGVGTNWIRYPTRMLQHRARGFTSNDTFPDALYGLPDEYEAIEITESKSLINSPSTNHKKGMEGLKETLNIIKEPEIVIEGEVVEPVKEENNLSKLDELKELINQRNITKASITIAINKFGVASIDDLTEEMIDKWTNYLKSKENK